MWASVCAADSETRRRAVPFGTVGGRIAGTHRPRSRSAFGDAHGFVVVADDHRLDGGRRGQQAPAGVGEAVAQLGDELARLARPSSPRSGEA
jgi:hypothetical protein